MSRQIRILIVDDEESFVRSLSFALRTEGMDVTGVHSGEDAFLAVRKQQFDIILLDLRLPGADGMEVLTSIQKLDISIPVIMISAHGDTRAAVQAVKNGAADYLSKPFELDELIHTIKTTLDQSQVALELDYHRRRDAVPANGLIGDCAAMSALRTTIDRVAQSSASRILLLGESGTGKALVARAIHSQSPRQDRAFVEVNCAALPEQLIESELFGAEKGSYTGAHQKRTGLVRLADSGTLFLDEIGELPLALQAKFLHFLENGDYRPVGAERSASADVRVIAATNRDLAEQVRLGQFREDLFYRLNVITIDIPALRARGEDILSLVSHFADRQAQAEGCRPIEFDSETQGILRTHPWRGNVRELKNLIERLTILYPGKTISADVLPGEFHQTDDPHYSDGANRLSNAAHPQLQDRLDVTERHIVQDALEQADGHKGRAAEILGISRHALKRRLQRLGLQ
ncbi:sigma-54-dependent transcriptional regulator [Thalassospira lucentensis]|uniref:sigma-54-dependent transcriptional regulator n=1 Tax=Thalassospira lucentensis TaxID=168935 RepID=UPI0003B6A0EF|nr:sigma-54 dependent transcriptional regulator [Thalassospira lucentensis]RCK30012.1 chemotaxis protein CheY [Thalassospira lucentensis MCCC 1A00383 = DSM 14000]